jgi:hypothetical protein
MTTRCCTVFGRHSARYLPTRFGSGLIVTLLGLSGCSYLETQLARTPTPDTRVEIGWQDRLHLSQGDIPKYACPANYVLRCERGGAITYSCTCVR